MESWTLNNKQTHLLITILGATFFLPFLGSVHLFDWDEVNFAEAAREMLVSGDWMRVTIDYQMFWEKPPLFLWMQALSMKMFGINEFAARFPNAVLGILQLNLFYFLGKKLHNVKFGWLWALVYLGSFLPHFYFKTAIIDPWFNAFIYSGFVFHFLKKHLLAGLMIGLSVLTKGPVGLLIFGMGWGIHWLLNIKKDPFPWLEILKSISMVFLIPGIWFAYDFITNGPDFIIDFITYQIRLLQTEDAGHKGPFIYHWLVVLIGCFPLSAFVFNQIKWKGLHTLEQGRWMQLNWVMFLSVITLFSLVQTKIVHYSSFCYLPLSYLAVRGIISQNQNTNRLVLLVIGSLLSLALIGLPLFLSNQEWIEFVIKDKWALEKLQGNPEWHLWETIGGIALLGTTWWFFLKKSTSTRSLATLFLSSAITLSFLSIDIIPKIESISQKALIEMFEEVDTKTKYLEVLGFKSYAKLFYSKKLPGDGAINAIPYSKRKYWLCLGEIDKDVVLIVPSRKKERFLKRNKEIMEVKTINGWTMLERKAKP